MEDEPCLKRVCLESGRMESEATIDMSLDTPESSCVAIYGRGYTPKLTGYEWWNKQLNAPKYICAPMVDQSELAFRMLCLDHGVDLGYTPMINSKMFLKENKQVRDREFSTNDREIGKVIAQFCGDSPSLVLEAAQLIEKEVDGIDLNCGCPQGIAKKGHYGSFLLEEPDLICRIISTLHKNLEYAPVTCKIRKVNNKNEYQDTMNLCEQLRLSGVSAIGVHGRIKEEKGHHTKEVDWDVIKLIKQRITDVPIIANGGMEHYQDVVKCFEYTKCDAVMSAEGLLEDVQMFKAPGENRLTQDEIMEQYLQHAIDCGTRPKTVKSHAFHMLYAGTQVCTDLRERLGKAMSIQDIQKVCADLKQRRLDDPSIPQMGWYRRYRK